MIALLKLLQKRDLIKVTKSKMEAAKAVAENERCFIAVPESSQCNGCGPAGVEISAAPTAPAARLEMNPTEAISHEDFVVGVTNGTMGFVCLIGEPYQLLTGAKRKMFNVFVLLYLLGPLIVVPGLSLTENNWWLLFGVLVSYAATISALRRWHLTTIFALLCAGVWIKTGFSIHQYITIFFFCAVWGSLTFRVAEQLQRDYALHSLVKNPALFYAAIEKRLIQVTRKPAN